MRSLVVTILIHSASVLQAQVAYEEAIADLAKKLNTGLSGAAFKTVLVSPFKQLEGHGCSLSSTITLDLEGGLVAQPKSYKLLDRQNLEALATEHKLEMNGMMDEEQRMREAGKLLKADAMVFGYFTYTGELLVLRVKAIDIQTSEQVSVLSANCTPNAMLKALCGPQVVATATPTRSAKEPLPAMPSNTVDAECATKRVGSYCFKNNSGKDMRVIIPALKDNSGGFQIGSHTGGDITVPAQGTECFYDKPAAVYNYTIYTKVGQSAHPSQVRNASIRIEPCQTGTYSYP